MDLRRFSQRSAGVECRLLVIELKRLVFNEVHEYLEQSFCAQIAIVVKRLKTVKEIKGNMKNLQTAERVVKSEHHESLSMIWWKIEGFHFTVGAGCRKLGGHGREMILRRNGDSHLVNVEFEDELQGCKKPMSRDDP